MGESADEIYPLGRAGLIRVDSMASMDSMISEISQSQNSSNNNFYDNNGNNIGINNEKKERDKEREKERESILQIDLVSLENELKVNFEIISFEIYSAFLYFYDNITHEIRVEKFFFD